MLRTALLVCSLLLPVSLTLAQGTASDYERSASLYARTGGKVFRDRVEANFFDGDARLWYVNALPDGAREFILVDCERGQRSLAFDHARLAELLSKAGKQTIRADRLPLEQVRFSDQARQMHFRALDKFWRFDRQTGELHPGEAIADKKPQAEPIQKKRPRGPRRSSTPSASSPDGRWTASVQGDRIVLREKEGKDWPLTRAGKSTDRFSGEFFWSPDSRRLVALSRTTGTRRTIHLIESSPRDQLQPKLHSLQYDKPGDEVSFARPHLFDVEKKLEIPLADDLFRTPWSNTGFRWESDSSRFTFVHNARGHQALRVLAVEAGSGKVTALVDETSKTFIDYAHKQFLHWLPETGELIWMSERDGWNHLYLYDARTGQVKNPLTHGEWVVRGVDRIDPEKRQVWFHAGGIDSAQDPYHVHYCRIQFDGTGLVRLTQGDGNHRISYSPQNKYLIDTYSRVDLPPITELRRVSDGQLVCTLEKADIRALQKTAWRMPERFVAKGRDDRTDIHGVIFRPSNFDPNRKYPVIEEIYAGPQGAFVPKTFRAVHPPQSIAELGFIVVKIDGMGTSHRSKAFHDVCCKNLGDSGFPDRIKWIKAAAAKYPQMDLSRGVGIYGGSAGGQSAVRGLLAHGDFYKVGVADCGCHDNRVDKIWWNELWMGWPIGPHYAEQSNVTNAHKLTGKLLLVVGEMDRNVDPASTMQVVNALVKADRDFELLVIPGAGHGAAESPYGQRRRKDFFVRHLLGVEPRH